MVAPSQALEFVLSYGIDLHSLPTTFSTHDILYPHRSVSTTFCTHDVLDLTTLPYLLHVATRPKASNDAVTTIRYQLTRRREGRLLHLSALEPSPETRARSNADSKVLKHPFRHCECLIYPKLIHTNDKLEPTTGWHRYLVGLNHCASALHIYFVHFFRSLEVSHSFYRYEGILIGFNVAVSL
jgi:hypothetical protein